MSAVDEEAFYASLNSLEQSPAPDALSSHSSILACAYTMLCVSTKLEEDESGALSYFERARDYLDLSMREEPTQHLVSALLVMHLLPPSTAKQGQGLIHVTLAHRLAGFIPSVSIPIRFCSSGMRYMQACTNGEMLWPPSQASIGEE